MFTKPTNRSRPLQTPPRGTTARRTGQLLACIICGTGLATQSHAAALPLQTTETCDLPTVSTVSTTWTTQYNRVAHTPAQDQPAQSPGTLSFAPAPYSFTSTMQLTSSFTFNNAGVYTYQFDMKLTRVHYNTDQLDDDDATTVNEIVWQFNSSGTMDPGTGQGTSTVTVTTNTPTTCPPVPEPTVICPVVVVDSDILSAPEPATLSMLALGGLALIRRGPGRR